MMPCCKALHATSLREDRYVMLPRLPGRAPLGLKQAPQADGTHQPTDHHKQQQQQQVADLAVGVLLSTNSSSPYAKALLRPLHTTSYAGREAALRTIKHLKLVRCKEEVPYSRQLSVLAAATSAVALTIRADQIAGLLEAWEQQQLARDLAVLEATLNHILDMEEGLRGAPYIAASSTRSSASASTTISSSRGGTMPSSIQPIPAPAAKPHPGPHLERILVVGSFTPATVPQLVRLLDALPCTQHLQHLALRDQNIDDGEVRWGEATIQPWAPWRQANMHAAYKDHVEEYRYRWQRENVSSGGSKGSAGGSTSSSSCGGSTGNKASSARAGSSWRSSCHVVQWWYIGKRGSQAPDLSTLQPLLGALQQVWGLYLPGPPLGVLPKYAASLQRLQALDLQQVTGVHTPGVLEAVASLTNLRSLGITHCGLNHVPAAFTALVHLTHLDLSVTGVTSDGLECLSDMTSLRRLELCKCPHLLSMPDSIRKLTGLECLTLARTAFQRLPEFLTALPKLHTLFWSSFLTWPSIPMELEGLWRLTGLQQLSFEAVGHTSLPIGISRLTGLTGLLVVGSTVHRLPTCISALVGLERLSVYATLMGLTEAITALTKLTRIDLRCDPLEPLSPAVAAFVQPRRGPPIDSDDEDDV